MPSDKEQKKSPEEEAEEKKYSFLQEKIKGKQGSRETLIKQFIRIAIYGLILGMFACLGFFALKPWAQNKFLGNPKTVTIPEDEEETDDQQTAESTEGETV
ncbi:MAG: trypsin, partial [[Ruminococcus] torques]|nr:trypsin [[Ruminococcus] torques]